MKDVMGKRPFLLSGLLGIAVILVSLLSLIVFPRTSPGQIEGIRSPIIAFEFAQTVEEINTLFGSAGSPERADMVRQMNQGNSLDYVYMLLYSGFLFSFSWTAAKQSGQKWLYLGTVLAVLALLGDALENVQLLTITANIHSGDFVEALKRLHWLTWLKWGSLAVYFLLMAGWFWGNGRYAKFIAITGILTFLLGLASFMQRGATTEPFTLAVALMFLLMIIFCFTTKTEISVLPESLDVV
ncbi:MAG: hypothetical protein IAF02_11045 [Anaerolineae bacterium]|nr:hypothetical protein [Anaerolineae bacterium]